MSRREPPLAWRDDFVPFVQITAATNSEGRVELYALDQIGRVWIFLPDLNRWAPMVPAFRAGVASYEPGEHHDEPDQTLSHDELSYLAMAAQWIAEGNDDPTALDYITRSTWAQLAEKCRRLERGKLPR